MSSRPAVDDKPPAVPPRRTQPAVHYRAPPPAGDGREMLLGDMEKSLASVNEAIEPTGRGSCANFK
jgi:hypothetical protein